MPAPLFYVSSSQINVQAPFELTGSETARIEIDAEQTGATSATVPVLEASPAIFTLASSGRGRAVAINPSGSVNDRNNPAAPGDVITVYASGLGQVQPEPATGSPAPEDPPAAVVAEVTAAIGGAAATVNFAGLAPGFVGLYQLNIEIPADAPVGVAVPIQFAVGDNQVENLTWISVSSGQ